MKMKKNRVLSFLLALLMVVNVVHVPVYAEGIKSTDEIAADICEICGDIDCEAAHVLCKACGEYDCKETHEPVVKMSVASPSVADQSNDIDVCDDCEENPCICKKNSALLAETEEEDSKDIWDKVDSTFPENYAGDYLIGFVDNACDTIPFLRNTSDEAKEVSEYPEFFILTEGYSELDGESTLIYRVDTFDMDLWSKVLASGYDYVEAEYFTEIVEVSSGELSATISGASEITLWSDLEENEHVSVEAETLDGVYVVEDICLATVGAFTDWYIQLVPDETWPEEAEEYCWIQYSDLGTLTVLETQEPDPSEDEETIDIADVWNEVVDEEEICKIGFIGSRSKEITFIEDADGEEYFVASASNCPNYFILDVAYEDEDSSAVVYRVNSFDEDFRETVIADYSYLEAKYFADVVDIDEVSAVIKKQGMVALAKKPEVTVATDTLYVNASVFSGAYAIEEFIYDAEDADEWFFQLIPDETWPEGKEDFVWVNSSEIEELVMNSTQNPGEGEDEELVYVETKDEIDGTEVMVSGNMPEGTTVSIEVVDVEESDDPDAPNVYGAFDIKLIDKDGNEWQPTNGEILTVTLSTGGMGLEDGHLVRIMHEHDQVTNNLGTYTVEDGLLTFEVRGFSIIRVIEVVERSNNALDGVVYFDLNAGNVAINGKNYSGARYENGKLTKIVGELGDNQSYYVYQSNETNKETTGIFLKEETTDQYEICLPEYERVSNWAEFITNNTDIDSESGIIAEWDKRAEIAGRSAAGNNNHFKINVSGNIGSCEMVIDNIWSSKERTTGQSGTEGGIVFVPSSGVNANLTIRFKGDNRFNNIYYEAKKSYGSEIIFEGVKEDEKGNLVSSTDATMTVVNLTRNKGNNYWGAAIGANDSFNDAYGIKFISGTVFAGTNFRDDCTAIGGGGNGIGGVTITGDSVITAVSHSSGTAIGGGIGKTSNGGAAEVVINGTSKVYAYNHSSGWQGVVIPSVAIGGGSSSKLRCDTTYVTISDNCEVFAQTIGGTAIGGGSSSTQDGANSIIDISGNAKVTALSVSGDVTYYYDNSHKTEADINTYINYPAGASIGGGTGGTNGNGGSCTLRVSENCEIYTGSIGGGGTLNKDGTKTIGTANVTISGGKLQGQVIMAATGNASKTCSFDMTGGTVDNSSKNAVNAYSGKQYVFLKENGGVAYVENGKATFSGGTIQNTNAKNGGAFYVTGGSFEMNHADAQLINATATENGGAVCVVTGDAVIKAGTINNVSAANGGAIAVSGGSFEMTGGTISEFSAMNNGGAVYVMNGTAEVGGTITGSSDELEAIKGGAAYVGGGSFEMNTGTINNCNASELGGAVCVEKTGTTSGTAILSGGTIENVEAPNGGAVAVSGGSFEMKGTSAKISNATANSTDASVVTHGGAVYVASGDAEIKNGTIETVSAQNGGAVAVTGGTFEMSGGEISSIKATSDGTKIDGLGGAVYVANGIAKVAGGEIKGHETDPEAGSGGGVYVAGGSFEMTGGTMTNFNVTGNGGMVCVMNGSATIQGGTISGNSTERIDEAANGGAVYVGGGNFTIDGSGHIEDCNATTNGGGVYLDNGTFTVSGGTFKDCTAATHGGGVYMGGGTFNMNGGTFDSCTAQSDGGGVYLGGGTFNMTNGTGTGGSISGCSAANGGGAYLAGGTLNMAGGSFTKCKANTNGGAVCIMNGTAYITDGRIEGDNSVVENTITPNGLEAANGGGIYVGGGILDMSNGTITKCSATSGGAAYITGGECNMKGGTVSHNYAQYGGGMYVENTPVTYGGLNNITVAWNEAAYDGGGMYISQSAGTGKKLTTITTGSIDNNKANRNGGGIYHTGDKGECTVSGTSTISNNIAANGGGLYIIKGSILNVAGGHICMNQAVGKPADNVKTAYDHDQNRGVGGGVYVGPGTTIDSSFTMPEGKAAGIYSNTAEFAADDVYANINSTVLKLPNVSNMYLGPGLVATGWYGDYAEGDEKYNVNTLLDGSKFTVFNADAIKRYRTALGTDTRPYLVTDGLNPVNGKYICLTIGSDIIKFGQMKIIKNGSISNDQCFIFRIQATTLQNDALEKPDFEVVIKGNNEVTIDQVPFGTYTVTEVESWSWRYRGDSCTGKVWESRDVQVQGEEKPSQQWNNVEVEGTANGISNVTVNYAKEPVEITFENKIDEETAYIKNKGSLWLDGNSDRRINIWGKKQSSTQASNILGRLNTLFVTEGDER